jgi:hypothetical protein
MDLRLRRVLALAVLALAGCAGGNIGIRTGNASAMHGSPPPGTSYSSAAVRAEASPNAYFGAVFFGSAVLGMQDDYRRMNAGPSWRRPPDLAEGRAIAERDCSQPLGIIEGNLRCR